MKTMKKLFLESNRLKISGLLIMAVFIFSGCASTGGGKESSDNNAPPGTLTITGIPAEYEGKFVSATMMDIPDTTKLLYTIKTIARGECTTVMNGEVKLPVNNPLKFGGKPNGGYNGSDTVNINLLISETFEESNSDSPGSPDAVFGSVTFNNGMAEANWDDAAKAGYITVTNITIPELYYYAISVKPSIFVGKTINIPLLGPGAADGTAYGSDMVNINDGILKVRVLLRDKSGHYYSFSESGTKDITLNIPLMPKKGAPGYSDSGVNKAQNFTYLFKAVQIIDGKATIDFRRGVKQ